MVRSYGTRNTSSIGFHISTVTLTIPCMFYIVMVYRVVSFLSVNSEMIHTASLLHDDVIDMSDQRRGVASVNSSFGNKLAVLAGDFLLARSSVSLARLRNVEVMEVLSVVIEQVRHRIIDFYCEHTR